MQPHHAMMQASASSCDSSAQQVLQCVSWQQPQQQQLSATVAADIEAFSSFLSDTCSAEQFPILDEDVDMAMDLLTCFDADEAALPTDVFSVQQLQPTNGHQQQKGWMADSNHPLLQVGAAAAVSDLETDLLEAFDAYLAGELQHGGCESSSLARPQQQQQQTNGVACNGAITASSCCPQRIATCHDDSSIAAAPAPALTPVAIELGSTSAAAAPQIQYMSGGPCTAWDSCCSSSSNGSTLEQQLRGQEGDALYGQLCKILAEPLMAAAAPQPSQSDSVAAAAAAAAIAGTPGFSIRSPSSTESTEKKVAGMMGAGPAAAAVARAAAAASGVAAAAAPGGASGCSMPQLVTQSSLTSMMTNLASGSNSSAGYGAEHFEDQVQQRQQQQQLLRRSHSSMSGMLMFQPRGGGMVDKQAQQQQQHCNQQQQRVVQRSRSLPADTLGLQQPMKLHAGQSRPKAARLRSRITSAIAELQQQQREKQEQRRQQLHALQLLLQGQHPHQSS